MFPDSAAAAEQSALIKSLVRSSCEPHREFTESAIARSRNGKAIWQDLVDDHGFTGHYESVKRFVRKVRPTARVAHSIITTEPGEEGLVDYGTGPRSVIRRPASIDAPDCLRRLLDAVASLSGCWRGSRVRRFGPNFTSEPFAGSAEHLEQSCSATSKEGVLKPDIFDPMVNPHYHDVLVHYGVTESRFVRILDPKTGQLLREHQATTPGHFRIPEADRGPRTPPQMVALLRCANGERTHVGMPYDKIERILRQWSVRQIQGVLSLVKKHGFEVIDDCCRVALEVEVPTYRLVNKLVKRSSMPGGVLQQRHEIVRQPVNSITTATSSVARQTQERRKTMNETELERALRKFRLNEISGTRVHH